MRLFEFAKSKGSYAGVKFSPETVKALEAYQYDNNIPNPLGSDEFHSTLMHSTKYIPNFKVLPGPFSWQGRFKEFDNFGEEDENVLVIKYECPELQDRFDYVMKTYNPKWNWPNYIPHIALSYNVGDLDISKLPSYEGPIEVVSEYYDDLEEDWAADK
jgi:hypothetical protein